MFFRGKTCFFPSGVARQPHAAELPARRGGKEIAVTRTHVRRRRGARSASKNILVHHELAVVFSDCARSRAEAGIRRVRARCPLPCVAERETRSTQRMQPAALEEIALHRLSMR